MDSRLHCCGFRAVLEGFNDGDWISDFHEIKSTSGYVFALGGGAYNGSMLSKQVLHILLWKLNLLLWMWHV